MKQYFRSVWFEFVYLMEEIQLKIKHPKRDCEIGYRWAKLSYDLYGHPWYCIKRGVRNLVVWFPIIWRNDVYDNNYLLSLMDKQMAEMEDFWKSDLPHVCAQPHIAKRIAWTRKLYKMAYDEYYYMQWYDKYHKKHGDWNCESVACAWDEFGVPTLFEMKSNMTEEQKKEYSEGSKIAWAKDEKLWKLYFKNLQRCREWWD